MGQCTCPSVPKGKDLLTLNTKDTNKSKIILKEIREWIIYLSLAFFIVLFLNSEVFSITQVSGSSMENTLEDGDKLFLDKISYNFSNPEVGDNIVFLEGEIPKGIGHRLINVIKDILRKFQGNPRRNRLVKRVVGIPGDKIEIKDGQVYRNEKLLDEDYIKGITMGKALEYPIVVPEGQLFVMGDNRENSRDSRMFGFVDYRSVEGKIRYKVWPLGK